MYTAGGLGAISQTFWSISKSLTEINSNHNLILPLLTEERGLLKFRVSIGGYSNFLHFFEKNRFSRSMTVCPIKSSFTKKSLSQTFISN